MVCRLSGLNMSRSWRFVMRSVFDGGVGWMRGGIVDRSRDSGVLDLEEGRDDFGELSVDILK